MSWRHVLYPSAMSNGKQWCHGEGRVLQASDGLLLVECTLALVARLLRLRRVEESIWRASVGLLFFLLQPIVTERQRDIQTMSPTCWISCFCVHLLWFISYFFLNVYRPKVLKDEMLDLLHTIDIRSILLSCSHDYQYNQWAQHII